MENANNCSKVSTSQSFKILFQNKEVNGFVFINSILYELEYTV